MKIKLLILLLLPVGLLVNGQNEIYKDPSAKTEARVEDLLSRMTLDEKLEQLAGTGITGMDTKANERLGIPPFLMSDGPLGVRWEKSTAFPCGAAIAATWDTELVSRFADALATETQAHGRNYLLGPCVNIHRLPIGGRNFESYGEDPWLTSRLVVSYIKALQARHVIPSVKHYALNNQEWQRTEVNVVADERTMREIYLPSFEAAVKEANVWTVMSAYNKVNDWWCSENKHLLTDILKNEWGFKGLVVSDWVSTHSTVDAANNGLDLEMPIGDVFAVGKLKRAITEGKITEQTINEKVRRILRIKFEAGLFDSKNTPDPTKISDSNAIQLATELSEESTVLLKNQDKLLPLDIASYKKIAVIGPLADISNTGGGGSSLVIPTFNISPYQGIKKFVGNQAEVYFALGDKPPTATLEAIDPLFFHVGIGVEKGLKGEYYSNKNLEGNPILTRIDPNIDFNWEDNSPSPIMENDNFSVRWTGTLLAPLSRKYVFSTGSDDGVRFYINGKKVIDNWTDHGETVDTAIVAMEEGKSYDIKLEFYEKGGSAVCILGWDLPKDNSQENLVDEAVRIARKSDVAIVFVGSTEFVESEGFDRRGGMMLPGNQSELIQAVVAANPKTIVVLNTGTAITTSPWLDKTPALLENFFPGQEGGNAIANILFGKHNPSAKLPFSFIRDYSQTPAFKGYMDAGLQAPYSEGIFVGYRYLDKNNLEPTFPFGFGLSYTTFSYSDMNIVALENGNYKVSLKIKNTGKMKGSEVVQLYVSDKHSSIPRPEKELKGFAKVSLAPSEEKEVAFLLNHRSFAYYDVVGKSWKVEPGKFDLLAGSSSRDIRVTGSILIP
ncbi:MAG: glycoside hydrolase family 3 C-terminal domain-containing protein [Bacteroidetes bacterium]|nr:glycoside hydrolase family 3 C-terminal domain-containing protein [Bacteroidota bacterium]